MDSNFELALELLGIGMITVFSVLFLVVFVGNMIVKVVNRYMPEVQVVTQKRQSSSAINVNTMAAIVAAIQSVTHGKGKVVKVEKV